MSVPTDGFNLKKLGSDCKSISKESDQGDCIQKRTCPQTCACTCNVDEACSRGG